MIAANAFAEGDEENEQHGGQYPAQYNYRPYQSNYRPYQGVSIAKRPEDRDSSKIAYSITIDMELHPGTSLTPKQISESKCNSRYNSIRKAFAEFTGRPYIIPPVYNTATNTTNNTTRKNDGQTGGRSRKTRRR
jgi:hypothetical protein